MYKYVYRRIHYTYNEHLNVFGWGINLEASAGRSLYCTSSSVRSPFIQHASSACPSDVRPITRNVCGVCICLFLDLCCGFCSKKGWL